MRWFDWLILCLVIGYCAYILLRKKKHSCCGDCAQCKGCMHKEKDVL